MYMAFLCVHEHDLHAYKSVHLFQIKPLLKLALVCVDSLVLVVNALM